MDYFENIIVRLLEKEGKWVKQNVKVNLSKEARAALGKPSMPRPDIDLVAYHLKTNVLELWEAKSFLDSTGVEYKELAETNPIPEGRYKLLTSEPYRTAIKEQLIHDWEEAGLIQSSPEVKYGLVAGNIKPKDEADITALCKTKGWLLRKPADIYRGVAAWAGEPHEDDPYVIFAKLILRNRDAS